MIRLIASDLDGTLLQNGATRPSQKIFEQIMELKRHGILFTAASGRQYPNLRRLFAPIQDEISYIAENGALCICEGKRLSKTVMDPQLALRIIDAVRNFSRCDCIISGEETLYTESQNPAFHDHLRVLLQADLKVVDDVTRDIPEPILKIAVRDCVETEACRKHMSRLFGSEVKVVTSGNQWVDFIPPQVNKGTALSAMLQHLHLSPSACMAFGDQYNDIEMLTVAGSSYAMANAAAGVSRYANHVTASVEEVLDALLHSIRTGTELSL